MVVADASVLIALAKTGRIGLLRELYGEVAVGPRVSEEVIEAGREVQAPEVSAIEAAFQGKWMREVAPDASERRLSRRILTGSRLHEGEAEAIALASSRKLMALLDDKEARIVARAMAVELMGTAGILLEAFLRRALDFGALEDALEDLTQVIWLSPSVVTEILRRARGARA
jgi:predicted nucleic acid-binding protein